MYHPLVIFDGERGQLVSAVLRPGNAHAARGAMGVLRRGIRRLKQRFPQTQIVVRGASAFATPRVLRMVEELNRERGGIAYVIGLAQNAVLLRSGATALREARRRFHATKQTAQHFDAFAYAAESGPQHGWVMFLCSTIDPSVLVFPRRVGVDDVVDSLCERRLSQRLGGFDPLAMPGFPR